MERAQDPGFGAGDVAGVYYNLPPAILLNVFHLRHTISLVPFRKYFSIRCKYGC